MKTQTLKENPMHSKFIYFKGKQKGSSTRKPRHILSSFQKNPKPFHESLTLYIYQDVSSFVFMNASETQTLKIIHMKRLSSMNYLFLTLEGYLLTEPNFL